MARPGCTRPSGRAGDAGEGREGSEFGRENNQTDDWNKMLKPKCFLPREALPQPDAVLFSCLDFIPGLHVALEVLPETFLCSVG